MAKRRPNGSGWLSRRKDGRWQSALPGPDGKVSYFYGRSQAEALAKLEEAKRRREGGGPALPPQSFADHLTKWLESKRASLSGASYREYETDIRKHVVPHLGRVPVARLTPGQVQGLYNRLGATLAPATIHRIHNGVVYPSLEQAARWGLIARNVAALVELPKLAPAPRRALSREEARAFAAAIAGDRLEALYLLALTTGLRQGELLGLRWLDVDADAGVLTIRQQWKRAYRGREMGAPKSGAGVRQVALAAVALEALRRRRAAQAEERLRAGRAWRDLGLVFSGLTGGP